MATILQTKDLDISALSGMHNHWVYNGFDCLITHEITDVLLPLLDSSSRRIYDFERALQAPALEMMLRGILVDKALCAELALEFRSKKEKLEHVLNLFSNAIWDRNINPDSPKQLKTLFYKVMRIPKVYIYDKGVRKVSTNRASLEKILAYKYTRPIVKCILQIRDCTKKISVLTKGISEDGRIRTSYNIAGTTTGRWSSSANVFYEGDNLQNWTDSLRQILVADQGWKFAYIDLEQAESRAVAYITDDEAYIRACESGDLHTTVCQMVWKDLPWTGDPALDEKVAEKKFYRHFSYRDMAKRGGHGINYLGSPFSMAKALKIETGIMENFRYAYFDAFPGIPRWHQNTARILQLEGKLASLMGRTRHFFGRRSEDATLREAIAYDPQSTVGDILNLILWRVWKYSPDLEYKIIAQLHDAILIMYREEREEETLSAVLPLFKVVVPVGSKTMVIPAEAQVGWNWRKYDGLENPDGIKKCIGGDTRNRSRKAATSLLDIRLP